MSATNQTQAEFIRTMGFSRARLRTLIERGLPVRNGRIPVAKAKAWIKANVDATRKNHWGKGSNGGTLTDFRREREQLKVEREKLELAKAKGELIERAKVRKFLGDRARMERDQWIAWASAAAARIASSIGADHGRLFSSLDSEVRDHLLTLAGKPLEGSDDEQDLAG